MASRTFDIVVWGVGYTGLLAAKHLARFYAQGPNAVRFALAGRSEAKLMAARAELAVINSACAQLPLLIGDAHDQASLEAITIQTRVVMSCAGPYALIGDAVVAACVKTRTHYCDITGEFPWVRSLIDRHHAEAEKNGVLIVNSCGFDSIPSDLGALFTLQVARQRHGADVQVGNVDAAVSGQGGVSGGTVASILNMLETTTPAKMKETTHPFYLDPNPDARVPTAHDTGIVLPTWNHALQTYLAPYVMAPGNERCVRRSAALAKFGARFSYREGYHCEWLIAALLVIVVHILLIAPLLCGCGRRLMKRFLLPAPGQGPSEQTLRTGKFSVHVAAECIDASGRAQIVRTRVSGGEPGYWETSKMIAETAVLLATSTVQSKNASSVRGGIVTPAVAGGDALIRRLQAVGIKFEEC